uniref:ribonuclease H n=1 Tax=Oryzias latipes TaxID=8090 RepID=A0A3B3I440_ORYLA
QNKIQNFHNKSLFKNKCSISLPLWWMWQCQVMGKSGRRNMRNWRNTRDSEKNWRKHGNRKIKIMKGVRPGNTLSPVMFTAVLEEIFRRMEAEAGININGGRMNNLRFADDIILFAEKEEDLSKLLNDLNKEGRKDGMTMNKKKTKPMWNEIARKRRRKGIIVDGEQLEEVDEYKYLGRLLTPGNEMAKEIDERVTSAWKRFGQYSTFLRDQKMPMCLKMKIMNTVILPSMTYGAETWSLPTAKERNWPSPRGAWNDQWWVLRGEIRSGTKT